MPIKTLNMNKFFGNSYSKSVKAVNEKINLSINPKRPIENIEEIIEPLKQEIDLIKKENKDQNNSIVRVYSSFDELLSSSNNLKFSTEKLLKIFDEDAKIEKNIQKNEEIYYQKISQKRKSQNKSPSQVKKAQEKSLNQQGIDVLGAGLVTAATSLLSQLGDKEAPEDDPNTNSSEVVAKELPPEGKALLDAIAGAEATGYNIVVGGGTFSSYKDHPRIFNKKENSDAAGRYQFLSSTWDPIAKKLNLTDFSPENQDRAAWQLAVDVYGKGKEGIIKALKEDPLKVSDKLRGTWPSLPGGSQENAQTSGFLSRFKSSLKKYNGSNITTKNSTAQSVNSNQKTSIVASSSNTIDEMSKIEPFTIEKSLSDFGLKIEDGDNQQNQLPKVKSLPTSSSNLNPPNKKINSTPIPLLPNNKGLGADVASVSTPNNLNSLASTVDPNNMQRMINIAYRGLGGIV